MASILLVDDEKNIRSGLHSIISRSGTSFTDIDECSNGCGALAMMAQKHYDLLITDLLMPQMDGIELLAEISGHDHIPYTVILSAHDDFKYAQKAIKYGVKAYLLKPVDRDELNNILKKAEVELAARSSDAEAPDGNPLTEFCENQLNLILLNENLADDEIEKILSICGMDIRNEDYSVTAVNFCEAYEASEKYADNSTLNSYLKGLFSDSSAKKYSFLDQKGNIVVIHEKKTDIVELLDITQRMYGKSYLAGSGSIFKEPSGLRLSYMQAEYALRCSVIDPFDRLRNYSDISSRGSESVMPVRMIKNLAGMLDAERKDDISRLVHEIFDERIIRANRLDYLEKLQNTFRDEVIQYLSEHIPHRNDFIREQETAFRDVYEFRDIKEYVIYVLGYVMNINDALLRMKSTCSPNDDIDRALKYINENYCKDLAMAEVANLINLNYSYFSLLFKGRTGMNFVEYLKKVRMEKAMELLNDPCYKIYEISGMVGYNNTKHFTTIFREFTGISPKEYRERIHV